MIDAEDYSTVFQRQPNSFPPLKTEFDKYNESNLTDRLFQLDKKLNDLVESNAKILKCLEDMRPGRWPGPR